MKKTLITLITLILLVAVLVADANIKNLNIKNDEVTELSKNEKKALLFRLKRFKKILDVINSEENELNKVRMVNFFFNNSFSYQKDITLYKKKDFWATRKDFFLKGKGDCEDFVIAKYFTLLDLGVKKENLLVMYSTYKGQEHLVLAYKNKTELFYLDNNENKLFKKNDNKKLKQKYVINSLNPFSKLPYEKAILALKWADVKNRSKA